MDQRRRAVWPNVVRAVTSLVLAVALWLYIRATHG
jgi:hypothetical protein